MQSLFHIVVFPSLGIVWEYLLMYNVCRVLLGFRLFIRVCTLTEKELNRSNFIWNWLSAKRREVEREGNFESSLIERYCIRGITFLEVSNLVLRCISSDVSCPLNNISWAQKLNNFSHRLLQFCRALVYY